MWHFSHLPRICVNLRAQKKSSLDQQACIRFIIVQRLLFRQNLQKTHLQSSGVSFSSLKNWLADHFLSQNLMDQSDRAKFPESVHSVHSPCCKGSRSMIVLFYDLHHAPFFSWSFCKRFFSSVQSFQVKTRSIFQHKM